MDGVIIAADLDTLIAVVLAATKSSSLTAAVRSRLEAIAAVHGRDYGVTLHRKSLHIVYSGQRCVRTETKTPVW